MPVLSWLLVLARLALATDITANEPAPILPEEVFYVPIDSEYYFPVTAASIETRSYFHRRQIETYEAEDLGRVLAKGAPVTGKFDGNLARVELVVKGRKILIDRYGVLRDGDVELQIDRKQLKE